MPRYLIEVTAKTQIDIFSNQPSPTLNSIERELEKRGIDLEKFDVEITNLKTINEPIPEGSHFTNLEEFSKITRENRKELSTFYEHISESLASYYQGLYEKHHIQEINGIGRISFGSPENGEEVFSFWLFPTKKDECVYQFDGYISKIPNSFLTNLAGTEPGFSYTGHLGEIDEAVKHLLLSL